MIRFDSIVRVFLALVLLACCFGDGQVANASRNSIGMEPFRAGDAVWGTMTTTKTAYDHITVSMPDQSISGGGAYFGLGGAYSGTGGINFQPDDYELEVIYRPTTNNLATEFRIEARQNDGTDASGQTMGENFFYSFPNMAADYAAAAAAGTLDTDGFLRVARPVDGWDNQGGPAYGYDIAGDMLNDFDAFEGAAPNGLTEIQVQSVDDGSGALAGMEIDFKAVRFVPKTPHPYAAILDNQSINGYWGTGNEPGAYSRHDGTQFTNIVLDLQPGTGGRAVGDASGGIYSFMAPDATTFDGNTHSIELTAKLLPNNAATQVVVELLDLDSYLPDTDPTKLDGAANQIGIVFDTADFNANGMTTVSIPISSVLDTASSSWIGTPVWNFDSEGDVSIDEISVYQMGVNSVWLSAEQLNIEIESVKVVSDNLILNCDFDLDGDCDFADIDLLYANWGAGGGTFDVDASGTVDAGDIGAWLTQASSTSNSFNSNGKTFLIGDVDLDGDIDSVDLGLLLNNFNDTTGLGYGSGNLNDDASVDSLDLGLVLNGFGYSSASAAAVPEPSVRLWLLLIPTLLCIRRRS